MLRGAARRSRRWSATVSAWARPRRPPEEPPERIAELRRAPDSGAFITGNGIAARCRHVVNYDAPYENEDVDNDWWFCKADYLEYFFRRVAPRRPFVLFSHNSDRAIGRRFVPQLRRRRLVAWFAQNAAVVHPKLHALPIGIANPRWPHGDEEALRRVQAEPPPRTRLFDASFSLATNPGEREYCLEQTGLQPGPRRPFDEYLRDLAASYFCISPSGNGIDVHRTWEALYLRTIPVVTRSVLTEQHRDLPMIVLDDWSEFRSVEFSPELYERTLSGWSPDEIRLDRYLDRVGRLIAADARAGRG